MSEEMSEEEARCRGFLPAEMRGGFLVKRKNYHSNEFAIKCPEEIYDMVVTKYPHYQTKEPIVAIEFWDVVEDCNICHVEMDAEQFKKFKEHINSL